MVGSIQVVKRFESGKVKRDTCDDSIISETCKQTVSTLKNTKLSRYLRRSTGFENPSVSYIIPDSESLHFLPVYLYVVHKYCRN